MTRGEDHTTYTIYNAWQEVKITQFILSTNISLCIIYEEVKVTHSYTSEGNINYSHNFTRWR